MKDALITPRKLGVAAKKLNAKLSAKSNTRQHTRFTLKPLVFLLASLVFAPAEAQQYILKTGSDTIPSGSTWISVGVGGENSAIFVADTATVSGNNITANSGAFERKVVGVWRGGRLTLTNSRINSTAGNTAGVSINDISASAVGRSFLSLSNSSITTSGAGSMGFVINSMNNLDATVNRIVIDSVNINTLGDRVPSHSAHAFKIMRGGKAIISNSRFIANTSGNAVFIQHDAPGQHASLTLENSFFRSLSNALAVNAGNDPLDDSTTNISLAGQNTFISGSMPDLEAGNVASSGFYLTGRTAVSSAAGSFTTIRSSGRGVNIISPTSATLSPSQLYLTNALIEAGGNGVDLANKSRVDFNNVTVNTNGIGFFVKGAGIGTLNVANSQINAQNAGIIVEDQTLNAVFSGNSVLTGANGTALETRSSGILNFTAQDTAQINGNVLQNGGAITLNLQNQSVLTGRIENVSAVNLTNTARWNLNADSTVINLNNQGIVNFTAPQNGGFKRLTVADLSGGGAFRMNTDLVRGASDSLVVTGNDAGSHGLLVHNRGSFGVLSQQLIDVPPAGNSNFYLLNRGQMVDAGAYQYKLVQGDDPEINVANAEDWYLLRTGESSSSAIDAINVADVAASGLLWYSNVGSLLKRMGDLRQSQSANAANASVNEGAWIKTYGSNTRLKNKGEESFNQLAGGFSIGADKFFAAENGRIYLGGTFGLTRANRDLVSGGTGSANAAHLGAYAAYIADSGFYIDSVFNVSHFTNEIRSLLTDDSIADAKYKNIGVGFDVEAGFTWMLDQSLHIEPQFEFSMMHLTGKNYEFSNQMPVQIASGNLYHARAGVLIGRYFNDKQIRPYLRLSTIKSFGDSGNVTIADKTFRPDLSETRLEIAAGISGQFNNATYFYADIETSNGKKMKTPWAANLGLRYSW